MPELMYDNFKIINKKNLNNDDIVVMSKIYMPLIGIDSYALYFGLAALDENNSYTFRNVMDLMNINSIKSLQKAFNKLEGIGLIRTYKNNKNDYKFEMIRPYSIEKFSQEPGLIDALQACIGSEEVTKIIKSHSQVTKNYKEITKRFDEVFTIDTSNKFSEITKIIDIDRIKIENKEFNYVHFKLLVENLIPKGTLEDPKFQNKIMNTSFFYKLTEEEMEEVIIMSLDTQKNINYESISKNSAKKFRSKNNVSNPRLITKEEDKYLDSIKDDKELKFYNWLESTSPTDLLQMFSKMKPSVADIKLAERLVEDTGFPIAVINLMLWYVLTEKNGDLPVYDYFSKVANAWSRAGVKNVKQAMDYIKRRGKARYTKNKTYQKQPAVSADWYDDYEKNSSFEEEKEKMSKEEIDKILEESGGLFDE